jgi:hypothetical protein
MTINVRFHRVQSIKAPKGAARRRGDVSHHHDHADLAGLSMPAQQEINRQKGAEPVLYIR